MKNASLTGTPPHEPPPRRLSVTSIPPSALCPPRSTWFFTLLFVGHFVRFSCLFLLFPEHLVGPWPMFKDRQQQFSEIWFNFFFVSAQNDSNGDKLPPLLCEDTPCLFHIEMCPCFVSFRQQPPPRWWRSSDKLLGAHAMLARLWFTSSSPSSTSWSSIFAHHHAIQTAHHFIIIIIIRSTSNSIIRTIKRNIVSSTVPILYTSLWTCTLVVEQAIELLSGGDSSASNEVQVHSLSTWHQSSPY